MRLLSSLYTERIFSNGYDFPRIQEPKRLDRTCVYRGYFAVRVDHKIESLLYFVDACSGLFFFPSLVPNSPPSPSEENNVTDTFWIFRYADQREIARGNRRAINGGKKKIGVYYQRYGVELWSVEMADRLLICARIVGYSSLDGTRSSRVVRFIYGMIERYQIYYILTNGQSFSCVEKNRREGDKL